MNHRFQNDDIHRVSEQYADNELYQGIRSIGYKMEMEMPKFGMCPEECFEEVTDVLNMLKDVGDNYEVELDTLWNRKFCEYRRFDRSVDEKELRKVVGVVFGFVLWAIDSSRETFYRYELTKAIVNTIISENHLFDSWQQTLNTIANVPLPDGWLDRYYSETTTEKKDQPSSYRGLMLPSAVVTDRARVLFDKAFERGYMKIEDGRLKWIGCHHQGPNTQFAYFCGRIYGYEFSVSGNVGAQMPVKELEEVFGIKRLNDTLRQAHQGKKQPTWRSCIDELFE